MTTPTAIRTLEVSDYRFIVSIVDDWWGGRPMRALLPRLFFEHFNPTSFAIGPQTAIEAFLIGFVSQSCPQLAYIHFVGVHPGLRDRGLASLLYEHFFATVQERGCSEVQCITSPSNTASIAFHRRQGFELMPGSGEIDGVPLALDYAGEGQHRVRFRKVLAGGR